MAKVYFHLFTLAVVLIPLAEARAHSEARMSSDAWHISSNSHAVEISVPNRRLKSQELNVTAITTGYDILQQVSGDAGFSIKSSFPERQSAALSLVLSLTPMVVSSACITVCLFIISLSLGKPAAWCAQLMLSEVFGMLLRYTKTFTNAWAKYHPAVPSQRCRKERKKRRRFSRALILTLLVGSVGWLTNAGMCELIKKRTIAVKGRSITPFSVFLAEGNTIYERPFPPGCSSLSIYLSDDQPHFGSSSRFEICYELKQVPVPANDRNGTRLVQLMADRDAEFGLLSFSISQGKWRYEYEISAFIATQTARFRMMWESSGALEAVDNFEKIVTEKDLIGCTIIQAAGSAAQERTVWAARNCTTTVQESLANLSRAAVSNVAIKTADSPMFLGVDMAVKLKAATWNEAVIGYAEKGRVQAWVPIFIAILAWLAGLTLAWYMHLFEIGINAARCMHAASHDGECLKELWELESIPEEKMFRSMSEPKKVVLGMFPPSMYGEVSYFDAGDLVDLVGKAGAVSAALSPNIKQSDSGAQGRDSRLPATAAIPFSCTSQVEMPTHLPASDISPNDDRARGSNNVRPIPVQFPSHTDHEQAAPLRPEESTA